MTTRAVRYLFLFLYRITGQFAPLFERAHYTAIGSSGHISMFDEDVAKKRKLKPLNRFERWLFKPIIEAEQKCRRERLVEITDEHFFDDGDPMDNDRS